MGSGLSLPHRVTDEGEGDPRSQTKHCSFRRHHSASVSPRVAHRSVSQPFAGSFTMERLADAWVVQRSSAPPLADDLAEDLPLETFSKREAAKRPDRDRATRHHRGETATTAVPAATNQANCQGPSVPFFDSVVDDNYYSPAEARMYEERMQPPSESSVLNLEIKWQKGNLIGSGAYGSVYLGMNTESTELMAVKQIPVARDNRDACAEIDMFRKEVALLKALEHPNIVRYLGMSTDADSLNIFLEYVPSGSITSLLRKFGTFCETVVRSYTEQILRGLQYLHNRMIVHRDIKGANILVDGNGTLKLTDFGASKRLERLAGCDCGQHSLKGTPHWMAPEVIEQNCCCRQSDVWSLGITVIEMATGKPPYSELDSVPVLFKIANSACPPPIPPVLSAEATEFVSLCLRINYLERPNATRLLTHPFIHPLPIDIGGRTSTEQHCVLDSPSRISPQTKRTSAGEMDVPVSTKRSSGSRGKLTVIRVQPSPKQSPLPTPEQPQPQLQPLTADNEMINKYLHETTLKQAHRLLTMDQLKDAEILRELGDDTAHAVVTYTVLDQKNLRRSTTESVSQVREVLCVSEALARHLLRMNKWNVMRLLERAFDEGKEGVLLAAHNDDKQHVPPDTKFECPACLEEVDWSETTALECGHRFCNACWTQYAEVKIANGEAKQLFCMGREGGKPCFVMLDDEHVSDFVGDHSYEVYSRMIQDSFVDDNPTARWCPSVPPCGRCIVVDAPLGEMSTIEVQCTCGEEFCWHCRGEPHFPASCELVRLWKERLEKDSVSALWLAQNTKACPKCGKIIEKYDGCNLMTCPCGQYFCWLCGAATGAAHTWTSIEGHTCPKETDSSKLSKAFLQAFSISHERYMSNLVTKERAAELRANVEAKKASLRERGLLLSSRQADTLESAMRTLVVARRLLSWSHVLYFYTWGQGRESLQAASNHPSSPSPHEHKSKGVRSFFKMGKSSNSSHVAAPTSPQPAPHQQPSPSKEKRETSPLLDGLFQELQEQLQSKITQLTLEFANPPEAINWPDLDRIREIQHATESRFRGFFEMMHAEMEDNAPPADIAEGEKSKWRTYAEHVRDAVRAFDKAYEWADLVIEKYKQFNGVPEKLLVAKRLAQCTNSSLPSGLHIKALELYDLIFERLGPDGVALNLQFSIGLFPLFAGASIQSKVLDIVEKYYVPLGSRVLPCLGSLVLALLPGIEEPNGEFYTRTMRVLVDLLIQPDLRSALIQSVWMWLLRSPDVRLAALHFLRTHMPQPPSAGEPVTKAWLSALHSFLPEKDTLVLRALVVALGDGSKHLAQREAIELVCSHFRLEYAVFEGPQQQELVEAAMLMLVRREISLSRRVFLWLVGSDPRTGEPPHGSTTAKYFVAYGKQPVVAALKGIFANAVDNAAKTAEAALTPVRVLEAVLDRDEIGPVIIDEVLVDVLRVLATYKEGYSFSHDVITGVNAFLDMVDLACLWEFVEHYTRAALSDSYDPQCVALLLAMLGSMDSAADKSEYVVVVSKYFPRLLAAIVDGALRMVQERRCADLARVLQLALVVIGRIPPADPHAEADPALVQCAQTYATLYGALVAARAEKAIEVGSVVYELVVHILLEMHTRYCAREGRPGASGKDEAPRWLGPLLACCADQDPLVACASIKGVVSLMAENKGPEEIRFWTTVIKKEHFLLIARRLWSMLDHTLSHVHYEVAGLFVELERLCPDLVYDEVHEAMMRGDIPSRVVACQQFSLLWRLSGEITTEASAPAESSQIASSATTTAATGRPFKRELYLMLETLENENPSIRLTGRTWLADALQKPERILDPLLLDLLDTSTIRTNNVYRKQYDTTFIIHVIRLLTRIIESDPKLFMDNVLNKSVSRDVMALNDVHVSAIEAVPPVSGDVSPTPRGSFDPIGMPAPFYMDVLMVVCLRYVQGIPADNSTPTFIASNALVQTTAAELLQFALQRMTDPVPAKRISGLLQVPVLINLAQAVSTPNAVLQVHLLALLRAMVVLDAPSSDVCADPMFLQTLIIGLLQPAHRNVRCYWLEFVAECMPFFNPSARSPIVGATIECLCGVIDAVPSETIYDSIPAADITSVLKALDGICEHCIGVVSVAESTSPLVTPTPLRDSGAPAAGTSPGSIGVALPNPSPPVPSPSPASSSFFVMIRDTLGGSVPPPTVEQKNALLGRLPLVVNALLHVYASPAPAKATTKLHNKYTLQDNVFRILEPLAKFYPSKLLSVFLGMWGSEFEQSKYNFDVKKVTVDVINNMPDFTEEIVLSSIASLLSPTLSQKKRVDVTTREDRTALNFLAVFVEQTLSVEGLLNAWSQFFSLIKSIIATMWSHETALILLKVVQQYILRVNTFEEKKQKKPGQAARKERQDLVQKLVDSLLTNLGSAMPAPPPTPVITIVAPPALDGPEDLRVSGIDSALTAAPASDPYAQPDEKASVIRKAELNLDVIRSLGALLLPVLDVVHDDKDKALPLLSSLVHCLFPLMRSCWSTHRDLVEAVTKFIASTCAYPYAVRAWRKEVTDLFFYEADLWSLDEPLLELWETPIRQVMTLNPNDKPNFTDLLKIISKSLQPSPAIMFVNKENEAVQRARNIKRLAFAMLTAPHDEYSRVCPDIRERVVEALKLSASFPVLQQSVFLCLRVMFIRLSPAFLVTFWPTVLTELMALLSQEPEANPTGVLSACKFLDLVLLFEDPTFSLYQWIFLCERASRAFNCPFVPLLEKMAIRDQGAAPGQPPIGPGGLLRPLICSCTVEDTRALDQLRLFLSRFSSMVYANQISGASPDHEFIAKLIRQDMNAQYEYVPGQQQQQAVSPAESPLPVSSFMVPQRS
eukprot:m51a1_g9460 putative mitogen-activated protein kinase kinase kinase 3-like (2820) ;mRNA; f:513979-524589